MQKSVNNCVTVKKSGKTRIVYSKDLKNGCSYNWRADWATFVGKTYAQVVKAKNDLQGQTLTQPKQAVGKRQFKPTVLANNYNIAPVSCAVVKNVENIKHVKCKKVTKATGVRTLLKTSKPRDLFHCQTKNRFELLAPPAETSDNCVNIGWNNVPGSSESRNHVKAHSIVNSGHIKPSVGLLPKARQKTCQNHSENIGEDGQKHSKLCSENNAPDNKYDLALQTKNKNKIKMQQAKGDPTFDLQSQ